MIDFFEDYTWVIIIIVCCYFIIKDLIKKHANMNIGLLFAYIVSIIEVIYLLNYFAIGYQIPVFFNNIMGYVLIVGVIGLVYNYYIEVQKITDLKIKTKKIRKIYIMIGYLILITIGISIYFYY